MQRIKIQPVILWWQSMRWRALVTWQLYWQLALFRFWQHQIDYYFSDKTNVWTVLVKIREIFTKIIIHKIKFYLFFNSLYLLIARRLLIGTLWLFLFKNMSKMRKSKRNKTLWRVRNDVLLGTKLIYHIFTFCLFIE